MSGQSGARASMLTDDARPPNVEDALDRSWKRIPACRLKADWQSPIHYFGDAVEINFDNFDARSYELHRFRVRYQFTCISFRMPNYQSAQ
ncbi:hypothetical protein [Caballeronia concitans]|uniref:hypothetical protein n=1 Tax=Caballeronia concitans TaxID=1777133 RepID=UPI00117CB46B|nr:hypothetical protein [Caballeronia concitans]